jgi:hypothetical protein
MNNELWFLMKINFFYEDIAFLTESQEMQRIEHCKWSSCLKALLPSSAWEQPSCESFSFRYMWIVCNIYFVSTMSLKYYQLIEAELQDFLFPNACPTVSFRRGDWEQGEKIH